MFWNGCYASPRASISYPLELAVCLFSLSLTVLPPVCSLCRLFGGPRLSGPPTWLLSWCSVFLLRPLGPQKVDRTPKTPGLRST